MRDVRIVMMMMMMMKKKKKKSAYLAESASNRPDLTEGKSIAVEHETEGGTQAEASWQRIAATGTAQCAKWERGIFERPFSQGEMNNIMFFVSFKKTGAFFESL